VAIDSGCVVKTKGEATQRLSSGGAGDDTQPTPDQASWERCYPALTCNELLGGPLIEPRNVIFYHTQEPRNDRDPRCAEMQQQTKRGASCPFIQALLSNRIVKRPNV
jgi:hypothetical protein